MARSTPKNRRRADEQKAADALKARAEYLRNRKAQAARRTLLLTLLPIIGLVVAWLGYGVFREGYWEPRQPVARVEGDAISASDYGKRVQYGRRQMLGNLNNLLGMISTSDSSFITDYAGGQRTNLPQTTLDQMIDEVLIRKEAERRDLTVTDEDVDARIRKDLVEALEGPAAAAEETVDEAGDDTADDEGTGTEAEDGATADPEGADEAAAGTTPVGDEAAGDEAAADAAEPTAAIETSDEEIERAFERLIQPMLNDADMDRDDYERLIRAQLYAEKLGEALGEEIPATAKQVEADYLLFSTEQDAEAAVTALADGASWDEAVARFQPPAEGDVAADDPAATDDEAVEETTEPTAQPTDEPTAEPTDEPTAQPTDEPATAPTAAATASSSDAVTETTELGTEGDDAASDPPAEEGEASDEPAPDGPVYAVEVGERRWYTAATLIERLALTQVDADAIMILAEGETSQGVTGSRGTYVLRVNASDDARDLEEGELQTLKDGALEKWLGEQRTKMSGEINRFPLTGLVPAEPEWFVQQYNQIVGSVSSEVPLPLPPVAP